MRDDPDVLRKLMEASGGTANKTWIGAVGRTQ